MFLFCHLFTCVNRITNVFLPWIELQGEEEEKKNRGSNRDAFTFCTNQLHTYYIMLLKKNIFQMQNEKS